MLGQAALLIAAALLVAQVIGFFLLVNERDRWRLLDALTPAVDRFAQVAHEVENAPQAERQTTAMHADGHGQHFILTGEDGVSARHIPRQSDLETQLRRALANAGMTVRAVAASSRGFADSPHRPDFPPPPLSFLRAPNFFSPALAQPPGAPFDAGPPEHPGFRPPPPDSQEINLSARLSDGTWLNADFFYPPPPPYFLSRLGTAEIVLYGLVLAASLFFAARVIRPLNELASAASQFGRGKGVAPVAVRGPLEVRAAVSSFNAMASRVGDLLREKDQMIAAIGHDLRTPLATLRVRAESVEPEAERERLIVSIEEISKIMENILGLARPARADERSACVDLAALAESVVEEFCDLGSPVSFADAPRALLHMQPDSVKRLLRNLIENAIKFGGSAQVSIVEEPGSIALCVDDDGPGIPEADIARVTEPFVRLEQSRNPETGGLGLGLAIANSIAQSQGARLELINRDTGGIRARVKWPVPREPA